MEEQISFETNWQYKALKVIMYALLLTPLWFLSVFLFPFITTKVLYLRILIEIALVLYVILALQYPKLRPKWNWLTVAVWVYMLVIFVASIFGSNFAKSFMGTVERGEGIITMLHFAVYFTILPAVLRTSRDWYRYLMTAVGVIGAVGVYGLLQLAGVSFVIGSVGSRISGTIGNAAFFAAFMMFGIFLSVYLLYHPMTRGKTAHRLYLSAVLIITLAATYLSQTRGALVALVFTALLFALFLVVRSNRARVRAGAGIAVALLILAGVGIYLGRSSEFIRSQSTLERLATISPSDITTQSRFDTWSASFDAWKDRPILGYGYENYNIAFNKYFPARIFKDQGSQLWFDRAHDIVFDLLNTSGIVGLLVYFSIFFLAFKYLFRLYRKSRSDSGEAGRQIPWQMPLILSLALIAYFIQNIFVFDTQATYLIFFLFLAYISHLYTGNFGGENEQEKSPRTMKPNWLVAGALSAVMLVVLYFVNLEPALANLKTVDGIYAARTNQYRQVQPLFEQALSYGTYMDEEIRQRMIDFANEAVASGQLSPQEEFAFYRFTEAELKKSIEYSPEDVKNYLYLMTLYNRAARYDPSYTKAALDLADQTIALSPTRPQTYFEVGQAYFNNDMPEKGLEFFQKAVDLAPEPKESHFNYVVAAILAGREDLAGQKLQEILGPLGFELSAGDYFTLGRAYAQNESHDRAVAAFRQAAELEPDNLDYYSRLVQEYGRVCDLSSAKQALDDLVEGNPNLRSDADQFLLELQQNCSN